MCIREVELQHGCSCLAVVWLEAVALELGNASGQLYDSVHSIPSVQPGENLPRSAPDSACAIVGAMVMVRRVRATNSLSDHCDAPRKSATRVDTSPKGGTCRCEPPQRATAAQCCSSAAAAQQPPLRPFPTMLALHYPSTAAAPPVVSATWDL
eukprot:COSAG03_NODE_4334_length_1588_cov_0.825386_2_plen_153_part_00